MAKSTKETENKATQDVTAPENTTAEGDTSADNVDYKAMFEQLMAKITDQQSDIDALKSKKETPAERSRAEEQKLLEQIKAANEAGEEYVDLYVDKGSIKANKNIEIAVNGKQYVVPRGVPVRVPRQVADVYYNSVQQNEIAFEKQEEVSAESVRQLREYGQSVLS